MKLHYDPYSKTNQYVIDGAMVAIAFYLAYEFRFEGSVPPADAVQLWLLLPVVIAGQLLASTLLGTYRRMWRYTSISDASQVVRAHVAFSTVLLVLRLVLPDPWALLRIPVSVIAIQFMTALIGALGVRVLRRVLYQRQFARPARPQLVRRVLLIGAGSAGVMVAKELSMRSDLKIAGFLDDNPKKIGAVISGFPVLGPTSKLSEVAREMAVEEIVLCITRAPAATLKRLWRLCEGVNARVQIIPTLDEIFEGEIGITRLRHVRIEDLLGRQSVSPPPNEPQLAGYFRGKRVLISGAGGSIGSELARQLADFELGALLLLDKDENGLYELQRQFDARIPTPSYDVLIGDIRSVHRMHSICERFRPQIVFHAAAHKHVPMMELNPTEAILNNVFGTKTLAEQAVACGTSLFVFISTDKAVNPSSVMGASKRLAELMLKNQFGQSRTRFTSVRFGNVMNSRGSVIPIFQNQITAGGPVTLTDPEVSRYFMTIPEAVQLVMQVVLLCGPNGSIYVLDMGDPVRIADLARNLIELSGLRPGHDIRIETIGLRSGERLYEELVGDGEYLTPTGLPKISCVNSMNQQDVTEFEKFLANLQEAAMRDQTKEVLRLLHEFDFGFRGTSTG